jgi:poly(beta-D-mannuronate) lyase
MVSSNLLVVHACCLLLLLGCNSSTNSDVDKKNTTKDPVIVDVQEDILCDGLAKLNFIEAVATAEIEGYSANNAIDSSFISESRWSIDESDPELMLTLDAPMLIKAISITWLNEDNRSYSYDIEVSKDKVDWVPVLAAELSNQFSNRANFTKTTEKTASYVKIIPKGNTFDNGNHIVEVEAFGCNADITTNIELDDWYLSIPVDEDTNSKAESIKEQELSAGFFNAEFFFQDLNGGLVFRSPIEGAKTSSNTKFTRTELREMLRRGNTSISTQGINNNNWVFSSASNEEQLAAGGVDGDIITELAVNHVTTTGDKSQVGRVIIGQIHANDDEPIRVYYRKLPQNDKGSIYLAHELEGGDDIYRELIGTRSQSASNPENGIKLNEKFGYHISVSGNQLTLTIMREGLTDISETLDMSNSGYDLGGQYMYFKAGVYNQNNTGNVKDYVQATFYKIENTHSGYLSN